MLIVFEGLDGVGKSTIVEGVVESFSAYKMRTPSPILKEARQKCAKLSTKAQEALFDFGNIMASEELWRRNDMLVVCDRYIISTTARRIASSNIDSPNLYSELDKWKWDTELYRPTICIHLYLQENERQRRVCSRGDMTDDEERLNTDPRYRAALITAYSRLCDITIDLTGFNESQAINHGVACLEELIPSLRIFRQENYRETMIR